MVSHYNLSILVNLKTIDFSRGDGNIHPFPGLATLMRVTLTPDGKNQKDMQIRIVQISVLKQFHSVNGIISENTKRRKFKSIVELITTYGAETIVTEKFLYKTINSI